MIFWMASFKRYSKCWQRQEQQFWPYFPSWRPDTFPRHWTTNGKLKAIKQQLESHNWQGLYCTRSNSHLKNFLSNHQACFFLFSVQADGPSSGEVVFSLFNWTRLISSSSIHSSASENLKSSAFSFNPEWQFCLERREEQLSAYYMNNMYLMLFFPFCPMLWALFFSISWATEVNRSLRITIFLLSQKNSCEVRSHSKKIRVSYYVPLKEKLINSYQMVVTIAISKIC